MRNLLPEDVISLAKRAGLHGIEWGADVHVPPGDVKNAFSVGESTRKSGLSCACYGSYCKMTDEERADGVFESVVNAAKSLGAPLIRVWAGNRGSKDSDKSYFSEISENASRIGDLAEKHGIRIAFEHHGGTLTDDAAYEARLLQAINHPNIGALWQPPVHLSATERLEGLKLISPWLSNIHAFSWQGYERLPLSDNEEEWLSYLSHASSTPGERYVLLEFVKDDDPQQLLRDADVLLGWLRRTASGVKKWN
jgi:sugar phosphate isomerase/epimerase